MKGFFTKQTAQEKVASGVYSTTGEDPCEKCGLYKGCITPRIEITGEGRAGILGIGEGPGKNEDEQGLNFVGEAGTLFDDDLKPYGMSLHRDLWLINAVNCRPPDNRTPTAIEIACCRGRVQKAIRELNPRHIWLLGESAVRSFYGGRFKELGIGRWRGLHIPDRPTGAWVHPMYHPSFALRSGRDENKMSLYKRDFVETVAWVDMLPPEFPDPEAFVETCTDFTTVNDYLARLLDYANTEPASIALDWETSHIKPYYPAATGQKIWTAAIAGHDDHALAFPVSYPGIWTDEQEVAVKQLLVAVLQHPNIWMAAHNLQFEHVWGRAILNAVPQAWAWCTMNAAHVLDVRKYFCGLKFQGYINFGVEGYETEAKKYMKTGKNGLNSLDKMPINKLLIYNGVDAIMTRWLYARQWAAMSQEPELEKAYTFFHGGLQALADATHRGIPMDELYYVEQGQSLMERMQSLERRMMRGPVAKAFAGRAGYELKLVNKDFSAKDLRIVLYDVIGLRATKQTGTGLNSVDKEVIADIDHPWVQNLLEWRKLYKVANTYIAQFMREISNGRMNPWFPLHTTRSTRGSSQSPNFQNVPKRDEESKQITRRGVTAAPGCHLGAVDYGAQEVRTAAILSGDAALIDYCHKPDSDMHLDVATRIWHLDPSWVHGRLRFESKSGFVFAQFYGSYYLSCARYMWDKCIIEKNFMLDEYMGRPLDTGAGLEATSLKDHLVSTGIITGDPQAMTKLKIRGRVETVSRQFADFVNHVKDVEKWFWETFAGLRDWQYRMIDEYQRLGYVAMPFGFRRGGLLNNNKIFNTAIQGTAFHFLLWAYIQLHGHATKNWKSYLLGQIHDEMVVNIYPDELQEVMDTIVNVMENRIRETFDWINVPLVAEPELSPADGNWTEMKELEYIDNLWQWKEAA
jgi:DNA polymerase